MLKIYDPIYYIFRCYISIPSTENILKSAKDFGFA